MPWNTKDFAPSIWHKLYVNSLRTVQSAYSRSPCRAQPWYIFLLGLLPFLQLRFPDFVQVAAILWLLLVFTSFIPHFIIHSCPLPRFFLQIIHGHKTS